MIAFLIYLVAMAVLLAFWEIQIEGKDGWAEKLPCWRVKKGWIVKILGGRPLTGYHLFMDVFLVAMIHLPLFFTSWSWRLESLLIGSLICLLVVEDFFWFVFNPHYGVKNFKKGKIWWHPTWWGPVPDYYWWFLIVAGLLIYFGKSAIVI